MWTIHCIYMTPDWLNDSKNSINFLLQSYLQFSSRRFFCQRFWKSQRTFLIFPGTDGINGQMPQRSLKNDAGQSYSHTRTFILVGCQTAVKLTSRTIFFAPTLCKLNSILCRRNKWTCDLSRSHSLPSGASLKPSALSQSTCGKSTIIYESS